MRIAITGTHSSGKTTLARLGSQVFDLSFARGDTVRDLMRKHFPGRNFLELDEDERWEFENIVLDARILAEQQEDFISDGCALNSVVYTEATLGRSVRERKDYEEFRQKAVDHALSYDFIFYLPPEIPLSDDGFRPLDNDFRMRVDNLLQKILKDFNVHTLRGSVQERIHTMKEIAFR